MAPSTSYRICVLCSAPELERRLTEIEGACEGVVAHLPSVLLAARR